MDEAAEKITIDKEALVQAVLEWERQEAIKAGILKQCLSQLQIVTEQIEQTLVQDDSVPAKRALFNLFVTDSGWRLMLTDEQIEAWKAKLTGSAEVE